MLRKLDMALKVVGNNPLPLIRTKPMLQRINGDQFGAVYAVTAQAFIRELK